MNRNQRRMAEYNARKAAQQIDAANYAGKINRAFAKLSGEPSPRVQQAITGEDSYARQLDKAIAYHEPIAQKREEKARREHMKVRNPLGQQVNARQKMRGKSIPLI